MFQFKYYFMHAIMHKRKLSKKLNLLIYRLYTNHRVKIHAFKKMYF